MTKSEKDKISELYKNPNLEEYIWNESDEIDRYCKNSQLQEFKTKEETKYQRKKRKQREKRIKKKQKIEKNENEKFDFDTEVVIGMAQKNKNNNATTKIRDINHLNYNHTSKDKNNSINPNLILKKQKSKMIEKTKKNSDQNERRRRKKIKRIKNIVKWTSILLIIIGGTVFAMVSPIFNIQEIYVSENENVSSETIISLSGLSKGQNIFRFFANHIEEQIKEEPYIQSAEVKRSFPNAIQIKVKERKRRFSIEFMNGYAYINNQGYILEISNDKVGLPVIQGISTSDEKIVAGNRLEEEDLEKLETVIQIMDACKSSALDDKVTAIDISNKNEYSIYMETEKKYIYLGNGKNLGDKMLWVQAILKDNEGIEGEIYVNGDLTNNFKPRFEEKVKV